MKNLEILGSKNSIITRKAPRRLKNGDPRTVKKYNKRVVRQFERKKIKQRIDNMYKNANKEWTQALEEEYNKIHEEVITIRKK